MMEAHCETKSDSETEFAENPKGPSTEEERKEREHFIRIINAFKYYRLIILCCIFTTVHLFWYCTRVISGWGKANKPLNASTHVIAKIFKSGDS